MIGITEVEKIHSILIERYGGSFGIRDKELLESAINRPHATFGNEDLYHTPIEKAAAILESILINHPFIDGNKRTGYVLARLILLEDSIDIKASQEEKYKFVMKVSKAEIRFEQIVEWLNVNTKRRK
jgi:death-on-curing protein